LSRPTGVGTGQAKKIPEFARTLPNGAYRCRAAPLEGNRSDEDEVIGEKLDEVKVRIATSWRRAWRGDARCSW